jgi:hypothetical protein
MAKSKLTTIPAYYVSYIDLVPEEELIEALSNSEKLFEKELAKISNTKGEFRYAEGKWSVKEVMQHVIDTERIFSYRSLCIARGERKDLAGFDENMYAENSMSNSRTIAELIKDFRIQRTCSISMYSSFQAQALERKGNANGLVVSTELLGFISVGHQIHHINIIKERYLK